LGLESVVFLDDNPMERGLIRDALPDVTVPELGEDPAYYSRTLAAAGYFESITFSAEDRKRADLYQTNAKRVELQNSVGDLGAYLRSLEMEIIFSPFDEQGRARIAQLISKSNQFNLTTRRYSEPEVQALADDPSCLTLQVRLKDMFGDNGMISVIVGRQRDDATLEIDTWLMSCRVLKRGVEQMVLREIVLNAKARGAKRVVGVYLPTERNSMVANHYRDLGFTLAETLDGGGTVWELSTDIEPPEETMAVVRTGFASDAKAPEVSEA
jgi:FkbH-like protein